jgi:uncharacterized membrane protein YbhN (UPF0104 family)
VNLPDETTHPSNDGDRPGEPVGTGPRRGGRAWAFVKWGIGLGILVWLYFQNAAALREIATAPKDWRFAAAAFGLVTVSYTIMFARWYVLVRAQGFSLRFLDAIRYGCVGLATNFITPGTVGGDLFKAVLLARDQKSRRAAAAATVVLDRLLGVLGLFLVGTAATLVPHDFPESPAVKANTTLLWIGSVGGLAGVGLMLLPATTNWGWVPRLPRLPIVGPVLGDLIEGVKQYQSKPWAVLAALGMALVNNSGTIIGLYCCARAMQPAWVPDLAANFYFRPSAELFGAASMIPGGVGALEFAIREAYVLLNPGAVTDAEAAAAGFSAAIAFRAVTVSVSMIGLGWYLFSRREISQAMEEAAHVGQVS